MLSQAHRRSIHTSLAPVLGEEEADALMSELPASESDAPVTVTHFDSALKDLRIEMHDLFRKMTIQLTVIICTALVGGMCVAAWIGAAVNNGGSP